MRENGAVKMSGRFAAMGLTCLLVLVSHDFRAAPTPEISPYERQVSEHAAKLKDPSHHVRAGAAEALGYLRASAAAGELERALTDESAGVR